MIRSELVLRVAQQNPHLYETEVEAKAAIHFRAAKAMRAQLNATASGPEHEV